MHLTTVSPISKITFPSLPWFDKGEFSCAYWHNQLYLATALWQQNNAEYQIILYAYNFPSKNWQVSYQKSFIPGDYLLGDSDNFNLEHITNDFQVEILINQEINGKEYLELNLVTYFVNQRLRSEDGINFYVLETASLGDDNFLDLHQLLPYKDFLYGLPISKKIEQDNPEENNPFLYYYQKSNSSNWQVFSRHDFGKYGNKNIKTIGIFNDYLYGAVTNLEQGFQLWKTPANSPQTWELVMAKGAYGYALNQQISFLVEFQGALYISSSIAKTNTTRDEFSYFYNCGFELMRFYPDDDWDIIVGKPKFSPDGLKVPLAAVGAGFDDPYNNQVECLVVHSNRLYLGCQASEGFQLWCSEDGETWELIPLDKFSNYRHVNLETAVSTPAGLALLIKVNKTNDLHLYLADV